MVRFSLALTFVFAGLSLSHPTQGKRHDGSVITRQAGSENVGTGLGQQFITGQCLTSADCASGCCAARQGDEGTGECRARVVTEQSGGSCDFGGAAVPPAGAQDGNNDVVDDVGAGNDIAGDNAGNGAADNAVAGACGVIADASGSENVGKGNGQQFITGQCFSPSDCASGCCASGSCAARFPTENERGQTCDFTCVA